MKKNERRQKKCRHVWEPAENWREEIRLIGEMLECPVECKRCGLKATEMYQYWGRRDENGQPH